MDKTVASINRRAMKNFSEYYLWTMVGEMESLMEEFSGEETLKSTVLCDIKACWKIWIQVELRCSMHCEEHSEINL